jgi:hypothetical protein
MALIDEINADVKRRVARFEAATAELVAIPDDKFVALSYSLTDDECDLIAAAVDQLEDAADDSSLGKKVPHWETIFAHANSSNKNEKQIEEWRRRLERVLDGDHYEKIMTVVGASQPYYLVPEALDAPTTAAVASVLLRLGIKSRP